MLVVRDPDSGVADLERERHFVRRFVDLAGAHHDFALGGKFDRIAGQVAQDLLEAIRIARDQMRQRRVELERQLEAAVLRLAGEMRRHPFHRVVRIERVLLEHELAVGQAREVEHVVNQAA